MSKFKVGDKVRVTGKWANTKAIHRITKVVTHKLVWSPVYGEGWISDEKSLLARPDYHLVEVDCWGHDNEYRKSISGEDKLVPVE